MKNLTKVEAFKRTIDKKGKDIAGFFAFLLFADAGASILMWQGWPPAAFFVVGITVVCASALATIGVVGGIEKEYTALFFDELQKAEIEREAAVKKAIEEAE